MAQKVSFAIYDVRVTIDDGRVSFAIALGCGGDFRQSGVFVESVAGIKKNDVVARGHIDGLIHSIIESVVGLAQAVHFVWYTGNAVAFLIVVYGFECFVLRVAVNDEMLHVGIVLLFNRSNCFFNEFGCVISHRSHGDF